MENRKVLSLFTGGGGLDIGFHQTGFDIVACLEIDKHSCDTLRLNIGKYLSNNTEILNKDITTTDPAKLGIDNIDFIIGGPPCQSFSAAGRRAGGVHGINDTRGSLFWHYCRFLKHFQPKGFLFENVKGILHSNKSGDWEIIKNSFKECGYDVHFRVLDAADYGAPQHRERVIMVGTRNLKVRFKFPLPSHGPDSKEDKPYVTAGEAFNGIDDPNEIVPPYGGKYGHLLPDITPGLNYSFFTEKMGHPSPLFAWRSKFSGFLYKLDPNKPSKTVVAHQGKYDGPFHWKNRKLNISELKRIQSFPDDYQLIDKKVEAVRQIGNSVAPKLAASLARAVAMQVFSSNSASVDLMPDNFTSSSNSRKARKAKNTRKTTRSNKIATTNLDLFTSAKKFDLLLRSKGEVAGNLSPLSYSAILKDGNWKIESRSEEQIFNFELDLKFVDCAGCNFNNITAKLSTNSIYDLPALWDIVHECINESSSYPNLHPLYGHFTEPYPKFICQYSFSSIKKLNNEELLVSKIYNSMQNVGELSVLKSIIEFSPDPTLFESTAKKLRTNNVDLRTFQTNRTIQEGLFKICYPFSLHSKNKVYVKWQDKGNHKTGDVRVVGVNGEYKIEASST